MVDLLNESRRKLPTANKVQAYQLLTLVHISMNINQASKFFDISKTLMNRVRELKVTKGILSAPKFSRQSACYVYVVTVQVLIK